ncbi:hypothetical protein PAXRUDRAFT_28893 [Paxillus rubicundulus Ve08.2h10]|uniref:DNA helicase n=1 Tax=Paxillus rubicundulus Ve08.2h10 TaxID=930991 RepID=A0A0D0DG96_9AGAM|nr:hypothetical protein PAXRUDRAFT_28893 [Paxillus rubicundulus Ve08.2h10]
MGKQEISHQQVLSYLVGGGDYTSHQYWMVKLYEFDDALRKWELLAQGGEIRECTREGALQHRDDDDIVANMMEIVENMNIEQECKNAKVQYSADQTIDEDDNLLEVNIDDFEDALPPTMLSDEHEILPIIIHLHLASSREPVNLSDVGTVNEVDDLFEFITGIGGAGKSHVIKAIVEVFKCWYLILDEISMVSVELPSQISDCISEAWQNNGGAKDKPFGGINIIYAGNLGQMWHINGTALYAHTLFEDLKDAPVVFGKVREFAVQTGQEFQLYFARDKFKGQFLVGEQRQHMVRARTKDSKEALWWLPLIPGMPVMKTENIAIGNCVVNGSEGILHSVVYKVVDKE